MIHGLPAEDLTINGRAYDLFEHGVKPEWGYKDPQQDSFVVVVCDECQRVAGPYFRGTLAVLLRTHAMDQPAATHSSHWEQLSQALAAPPWDSRLRGHWRAESNKETEENFWLSRENIVVGFCAEN